MPIKKFVTALTAGSLVCLAVLGLRSPATAQHEKMAEAGSITKAVAQLIPTKKGRTSKVE